MITRIVIHKDVINAFKKRALKKYPNEYGETILGKLNDNTLSICAFDHLYIESATNISLLYYQPEEELCEGHNLDFFGIIHVHPNNLEGPSNIDWKYFDSAINDDNMVFEKHEINLLTCQIMGIMYLKKLKNVTHWSLYFYNINHESIEVIFSE